MPNLTRRQRALAAAAPTLVCVAALAGCGGDDATSGSADSNVTQDLQRQFVGVVDRVSPQVVQIQTDKGLGSGIVYDDRGLIAAAR